MSNHTRALRATALDEHPDIRHAVRMPSSAALAAHQQQHDQQPDLSSWPTMAEAAVRLGTNERTIRRWIDTGRLKDARRPAVGRKPLVIVDPDDVDRLRRERQQVVVVETVPMKIAPDFSESDARAVGPHLADQAAALVRSADPFAGLAAHLARLAAAFPTPQPKPWLNLEEAIAYSGLTRAWLLKEANAGGPFVRDMGKHARGGRWRFSREGLAK